MDACTVIVLKITKQHLLLKYVFEIFRYFSWAFFKEITNA